MNFLKIIPVSLVIGEQSFVAETSRGLALHTVDWYMHGKSTVKEYDKKDLQLSSLAAK